MPPPLYLIDASSYIYRAFYAVKTLTGPTGIPTNAVFGFVQMLLKVLKDEAPDYLGVVFDRPEPTFRHRLYPDYKATRQRMPEDLVRQLPYIKRLVTGHGLAALELAGYEADDLIATLAAAARTRGLPVVIVSADKDLHQLVDDPWVVQWDSQRDRRYDAAQVAARLGVEPARVLDLLALMGDSSDHVPGVPGVGPKTAVKLIQDWGSLDGVYAHLHEIGPVSLQRKLAAHRELAYLSRDLVRLKSDAPIALDLERLHRRPPDQETLLEIYTELGFKSLAAGLGAEPSGAKPEPPSGAGWDHEGVRVIDSPAAWQCLLAQLAGQSDIAVALEASSRDPMRAEILGIGLSWNDEEAWAIAVDPEGRESPGRLPRERVRQALGPCLGAARPQKIGHDLKTLWLLLERAGMPVQGLAFDTMVAAYLLEPGEGAPELERLAAVVLGAPASGGAAGASGKKNAAAAALSPEQAARRAARAAALAWRLRPKLAARLDAEDGLTALFRDLELPLVEVLARMERAGILVDRDRLDRLAAEFDRGMAEKAAAIQQLAGMEFNIQSPRQLGDVLFGKLGLPVLKKTKTGPSTDLATLEALAAQHPIAELVLAYRSLAKLKGTYADALPRLIHPETGRIHTSFNQTVTATGRLSSSEPNLQNIPIRSEEGRRIRAAFAAAPGNLLLSADYSQIELRVLAHFSGDQRLCAAFAEDDDIHRRTAAEMFRISPQEVTPEMRRQAKAINFGIIYGMGAFGLARQLGTDTASAKAAIERYFERYAGVKRFIEKVIEETRARGACRTLMGRRRAIPELTSRNQTIRSQGERLAVNTTIQGSAADLIKRAMLEIDRELKRRRLRTGMLLQVHDELVFEVPPAELETVRELVRGRMEQVWPLAVPLKVDLAWGSNWAEAHR